MNAKDFLAAAECLPFATLSAITAGGGLVVVAPHPDDESLGCGGIIAEACAQGVAVRLIVLSDGVGSHPASKRYPAARLRDLREAETLAATTELGLAPAAIQFLRLPDRFVPVQGPEAEAACDAIKAAMKDVSAGALCVTWAFDPHCDHVAAAELVAQTCAPLSEIRLFAYPVWGWSLPADRDIGTAPSGVRIDITQHLPAKAAAIAAHRSQTTGLIDDDPTGFRLQPDMLARFSRPYEILLEINGASA